MAVLDSTATAVPLPGQHNQTADPSADGAPARPCLPDPATELVREDRFLRDRAVQKNHARMARTDAHAAGDRVPSTQHALRCTKAASAVTADTILEDVYARI